jgi:hypothetical protein
MNTLSPAEPAKSRNAKHPARKPRTGSFSKPAKVSQPFRIPQAVKSLDDIKREQGWTRQKWEEVCGKGKEYWESDAECEAFIAEIYRRRDEER